MTLNSISLNFQIISPDFADIGRTKRRPIAKRMKIDQYCQLQRCKHVELEQFLACFRVARVCQRQLGYLVTRETLYASPGLSLREQRVRLSVHPSRVGIVPKRRKLAA